MRYVVYSQFLGKNFKVQEVVCHELQFQEWRYHTFADIWGDDQAPGVCVRVCMHFERGRGNVC
jgi:hypothetical protein